MGVFCLCRKLAAFFKSTLFYDFGMFSLSMQKAVSACSFSFLGLIGSFWHEVILTRGQP